MFSRQGAKVAKKNWIHGFKPLRTLRALRETLLVPSWILLPRRGHVCRAESRPTRSNLLVKFYPKWVENFIESHKSLINKGQYNDF